MLLLWCRVYQLTKLMPGAEHWLHSEWSNLHSTWSRYHLSSSIQWSQLVVWTCGTHRRPIEGSCTYETKLLQQSLSKAYCSVTMLDAADELLTIYICSRCVLWTGFCIRGAARQHASCHTILRITVPKKTCSLPVNRRESL